MGGGKEWVNANCIQPNGKGARVKGSNGANAEASSKCKNDLLISERIYRSRGVINNN